VATGASGVRSVHSSVAMDGIWDKGCSHTDRIQKESGAEIIIRVATAQATCAAVMQVLTPCRVKAHITCKLRIGPWEVLTLTHGIVPQLSARSEDQRRRCRALEVVRRI